MSEASEELVIAEKAPGSTKPGMLVGLSIAGIVIGAMKLMGVFSSLPWLLNPQLGQANEIESQPLLVKYQELVAVIQAKYFIFQISLLPLTLIVAGALLWASFRALGLKPRGADWIRWTAIAAILLNLAGGVLLAFFQYENYQALTIVFADGGEGNSQEQVMAYVMKATFYISIAATLGFMLLEIAYYGVTFRYFSKREIRSLYPD